MILQCPSCVARFLVADALIPADGRTVKCGKCAHQWFVTPDAAARSATPAAIVAAADAAASAAPATTEPAPDIPAVPHNPKQLPAITKKPFALLPFKIAVPLLASAWAILALLAYFPTGQHSNVMGGLYAALGAHDTRDLVFADVVMTREPVGARTRFLLSGSIANHAAVTRMVPNVRVQLKDKAGDVIWSQTYPVGAMIEPGGLYPFRIDNVETSFAARTASIVFDLGNSFELGAR